MKRMGFALVLAVGLVAMACTGGGEEQQSSNGASGGVVNLVMWHGYGRLAAPGEEPNFEYNSLQALVGSYMKLHPNVHIELVYYNNDNALTKLTVALQAARQPDITYQYGSSMPQLATTPKVVDLTDRVQEPDFGWQDFYPGERAAATVDGRVLGVPALVDNLAIVYNKDLFDQAGLAYPSPEWTWDDFRAAARALTDPAKKHYGWVFPTDGLEDTVWHWEAMLWEAGGDILNADNTKAAFNSPAGVQALTMLQDIAKDGSIYFDYAPDSPKTDNLFNSGFIGMKVTGPWALPAYPDANYGVQIMPSFDDPANHQTIAGPDDWVIMDNGSQRIDATWEFMKWFTDAEQVLKDSLTTGHLPTRASVAALPGFDRLDQKYPGVGVFAENLANVLKARPALTTYPQISAEIGQAVVKAMLGKATPQQALDEAATNVNAILAIPQ